PLCPHSLGVPPASRPLPRVHRQPPRPAARPGARAAGAMSGGAEAREAEGSIASGSRRRACWEARDAFFACVDAGRADHAARCEQELGAFEARCPPSWVKHFMLGAWLRPRARSGSGEAAGLVPMGEGPGPGAACAGGSSLWRRAQAGAAPRGAPDAPWLRARAAARCVAAAWPSAAPK
ncbi:unnamed protein product, partial [Prorocentrum cordatum]